jgi:hypothetical protein
VFDVMLRAIPRGSDRHEVYGKVGVIDLRTGEMCILQSEDVEVRQPLESNMQGGPELLENIRAWIAAAVQDQVVVSGYQPLGDFFGPRQ